ncbi:Organic cation transporter [Nesidiocoris tenuis]|uniref:Organic cation transporter n=1 Tax=Nesidiocoris tenuis TaxID=355587 RepID=A0ABN7A818_9HEMI|nr:Organic cation transporter [Nesidiocoris tenuis]
MTEEHRSPVKDRRNQDDEKPLDLDDLLPHVGEFGRYQKCLLWLVCLPACIPCGFCAFNQLFMAESPDHWCRMPTLEQFISDPEARRAIGIPLQGESNSTYEKCIRYAVNWTELIQSNNISELSSVANSSWPTEYCRDGWEFDLSDISSSIVIDFELVCQRDIYPTIGLAGLNLGGPFGVYFFGLINDRSGRRISFFLCLLVVITGNILTAVATNFWFWAVSRVIVGLTIPAVYQIPFIISLELVGPNYRSFVTVMTCLFYTLGLMLLAVVTYLVRDWRLLAFVTSLPFILYYVYWWFLPESPRWLLAKGRFEESLKILEHLARVNKKELPPSFKQKLRQRMMMHRTLSEEKKMKEGPGITALFRTPNMRLKTLLITLNWFANETVYVGLSYYGPALGSDRYLSFFLSSAVEIPSYLSCWMIMDHWGRRWPLAISMVISGISCVATVLLPADEVDLILILFLFSKFAISASFLIIYPFAGELYPTEIRGLGIGMSAYVGGLGLIIIPFITYLGQESLVLPLLILGLLSVVGGFSSLRLPETLHHRLPQTVEEGEQFGKNWTMADCCRCVPIRPEPETSTYEDLDELGALEMNLAQPAATELTSLNSSIKKPRAIPRLVRQASVLETPVDSSGTMKMTYWF